MQAVHQRAGRGRRENTGDSAHGEGDSYALFVPALGGEIDGEEWPDSGLDISNEEIQPVQAAESLSGSRSGGRTHSIGFDAFRVGNGWRWRW